MESIKVNKNARTAVGQLTTLLAYIMDSKNEPYLSKGLRVEIQLWGNNWSNVSGYITARSQMTAYTGPITV